MEARSSGTTATDPGAAPANARRGGAEPGDRRGGRRRRERRIRPRPGRIWPGRRPAAGFRGGGDWRSPARRGRIGGGADEEETGGAGLAAEEARRGCRGCRREARGGGGGGRRREPGGGGGSGRSGWLRASEPRSGPGRAWHGPGGWRCGEGDVAGSHWPGALAVAVGARHLAAGRWPAPDFEEGGGWRHGKRGGGW
nr:protein argonaute 2-like [Aegilops tauschii subsp. strangulata]